MTAPPSMTRWGFDIPFDGISLRDHQEIVARAESLGYTDAWTGEVNGNDAFTPLAVAALSSQTLRLGVGIVSAFTRGPGVLAMTAASLAELAPGRVCLGIGAGSDIIVSGWNSIEFARPLERVADVAAVVRAALRGEKVTDVRKTLTVHDFRLARPPAAPIPIFLAALRPRMLGLAGAVADGVLLNWLSAEDIPRAVAEVERGARESGRADRVEIACRVFVCLARDDGAAEHVARRFVAAYQTVPVYRRFQEWLGRGPQLAPMTEAWYAGQRREATELIPSDVLRDLVIFGPVDDCRTAIRRYRDAGVDTIVLHFLPAGDDARDRGQLCVEALSDFAPNTIVERP